PAEGSEPDAAADAAADATPDAPARDEASPAHSDEASAPDPVDGADDAGEGGERGDAGDGGDDETNRVHALRYFLEAVEVEGNTRTHASVIRAYVPLERGEPFDPEESELETLQFALMGTGWFDEVHVRLRRGSERGWVVVVVEVVERNTIV